MLFFKLHFAGCFSRLPFGSPHMARAKATNQPTDGEGVGKWGGGEGGSSQDL